MANPSIQYSFPLSPAPCSGTTFNNPLRSTAQMDGPRTMSMYLTLYNNSCVILVSVVQCMYGCSDTVVVDTLAYHKYVNTKAN